MHIYICMHACSRLKMEHSLNHWLLKRWHFHHLQKKGFHLLGWLSYTCRTYRSGLVEEHSLTINEYHKWMKDIGWRLEIKWILYALPKGIWPFLYGAGSTSLFEDLYETQEELGTWQNILVLTPVSPMTVPLFGLTTFILCSQIFNIFSGSTKLPWDFSPLHKITSSEDFMKNSSRRNRTLQVTYSVCV